MEPYEKIAKILRTDKDTIRIVEEQLSKIVGHDSVLQKIVDENSQKIKKALTGLVVREDCRDNFYSEARCANDIFHALISKVREDDQKLAELIHKKDEDERAGFNNLLNVARELSGVTTGRFLKLEKAKELILANPPQKIISFLGYSDANELLEKEDLFEIFAGLRFVEDGDWLNDVFFKPYEKLTPDDFEERGIQRKVLSDKWIKVAEKFVKKKWHNLSHLKEMGFVFIIPIKIDMPGAVMKDFGLALHYFHEVKFYSDLFERYAKTPETFAQKFISGLKGDNIDVRPPEDNMGKKWLIIQQYLAKHDEYDWRLFYPHVNPEAIHWAKAESDIAKLSERFGLDLSFWNGLGFVGDFYKDESGVEVLVSFNFLDTAMALFKEKELIKYLYHHQEAMWNKIFSEFFGEEKLKEMIIENFDKGIIEL